ncbi:flocculation protein FLO11-like [Sphaeramia orbicularis]|uniref:flocculation protein FLO11-like n=1 Tax=Sphaeramia orbicularis TaxID=375764 RepID=UPI00117E79D9|nr:flocculation protein FLO11-like [Sphaeramia orbicularis]
MELPLGGPALRHYTQSRPRPHRQKLNYRPTRPQETIIESENEVLELIGRVDEGVEEFFTKRVLPTDTLKKQDEETITVHEVAPASSVPCPPPTKTLRRKLGDFFTLKKRRGVKSETSHEGRPKKASIADLIRPLREVTRAEKDKDKDRVREHDKENEKEKGKEHLAAVTGEPAVQETPVSGAPPLRSEAVPPRRALREGKSQSLILLSGSAAAGATNARNKKQFDGQNSFEQKLHLMLQRIGVSKPQPGETQNQEGEMKKAESEGTIIDSKPEPPPTKPRTMSASSDTRHQIRPSVSAHESAGKPPLLPKPVIKPGPPPPTSGRNTPENELAQIQEGETDTPTKAAAPPTPAPALSAADTPTVPTISDSVPDSSNITVSPSNTVTPSDTDICTDSVNPTTEDTTPTNVTELDSKASPTTMEVPAPTLQTALINTATPTEPPAPVSVISTSSESITPSSSVTSTSTIITTPSITTLETVSAQSNESVVSTTSTDLSTKLTLPEPNSTFSADNTPTVGTDAAISVITTVDTTSSVSTSTSTMPAGSPNTANVTTAVSDESTLVAVTSSNSDASLSPVTTTTSQPLNLTDTLSTTSVTVSPDTLATRPSTLPPTSSTSSTTTSPISTTTISTSTPIPTPALIPSTDSSSTPPTNTPSTTTISPTAAAMTSPQLTTDSDPPKDVSTALSPALSGLCAPENSSATSQHLTSLTPSNDSSGQDNGLQMSPEERSSLPVAEVKTPADEALEIVQKSRQTEVVESKSIIDTEKENEIKNEKPTPVSSEAISKESQEKPEEELKTTEVGVAEAASGKVADQCSNQGVIQKEEETKSVDDK